MSGTNPSDPTPQNAIWSAPVPQAVLGLNSSMTYGSMFQCAVPMTFQLGVGAYFQVVVDPVGFLKVFPGLSFADALDPVFGGGAYGNIQLTLGTSAQIVMGKSYQITLGPDAKKVATDTLTLCKPVQKGLCVAMFLASLVYTGAYGIMSDDDQRAILTMVYQNLMQVGVGFVMLAENANEMGYDSMWTALTTAYYSKIPSSPLTEAFFFGFAELAMVASIIVPPIVDSYGEVQLKQAEAQQAQQKSH